jgi:glucose/arabinose dehydrogenase
LQRIFAGHNFSKPTAILQAPGDDSRLFIVEQDGKVWVVNINDAGAASTLFIDISDRVDSQYFESGLLGMAFHPEFQTNLKVYLSYTKNGSPLVSHVTVVNSSDGGLTLDPGTESIILTLDQPFTNHNGGGIVFGPDGYLYIGFGDGGAGGDPSGNAQNTDTLLGNILRIDVNGASPYTTPATNPFATGGGRSEIFAWGLRNPWKFSFNSQSGKLFTGDVGQELWEEIDIVVNGGNYGWNIREGAHCYDSFTCDSTGLIEPVTEYSSSQGCSVTGGHVYRSGTNIPAVYIYGDWCSGNIWGLFGIDEGAYSTRLLQESDLNISSFGQGHDGSIYLADYYDGGIYKIVVSVDGG